MPKRNPINPTTPESISLARELLHTARFGALGVIDPETGAPHVTRIAIGTTPDGQPLSLISDLSHHTKALRQSPFCSLLLGEPGDKGDPLTYPRITLTCKADFIDHAAPDHKRLRDHYVASHPKAQLYVDFADFHFVIFKVLSVALNGGFGKAFSLTPQDIKL